MVFIEVSEETVGELQEIAKDNDLKDFDMVIQFLILGYKRLDQSEILLDIEKYIKKAEKLFQEIKEDIKEISKKIDERDKNIKEAIKLVQEIKHVLTRLGKKIEEMRDEINDEINKILSLFPDC